MPPPESKTALRSLRLAHFCNDIYAEFMPTIMPLLIRKFGFSLSLAGLFANFIALLSSFLQPIFGIVSDRKRTRFFVILGPFMLGLCSSLVGYIKYPWQLFPLLIIAAIGTASFHPPATGFTGLLSMKGNRHDYAISMFIIAGTLGASISPLFAYFLLGAEQDLNRLIFAIPFGIIGSVAVAFGVPSVSKSTEAKPRFRLRKWKSRARPLLKLLLLVVFRSAVVMAFLTFLPEYFYRIQEAHGKSDLLLGALSVFLFTGSGSIGGLLGGFAAKKFSVFSTIIIGFIFALPLVWMFFNTQSLYILFLIGILVNLSQALTVSLAQRLIPENSSTLSSLIMGFGWGFAILLMPLLGYFGDMLELKLALQTHTLIFLTLSILVTLWFRSDLQRKKLFAGLALLLLVLPAQASSITRIKTATMNSGNLVIAHDSKNVIQFKKFTMQKPPTLVFDLLNSDLGGKAQKFVNPGPNIKEVRLAQFSPTTVRVAVEATNSAALQGVKFENLGQNLYFRFNSEDIVLEEPVLALDGELSIKASGAINTRVQKLQAPTRLVVDLVGASLKDPALKKSFDSAGEQIKVAQLDKSTLRIVFTGVSSQTRQVKLSVDQKQLIVTAPASLAQEVKTTPDKGYALSLLSQTETESVFLIQSTKDISYKFLNLHNPERLVLDLYGIAYDAKQVSSTFVNKTNQVTAVRFGIATLGRPVTRVVFDLAEEALIEEFKAGADNKQLIVRVYKIDPSKSKDGGEVPQANKALGAKVVVDAGHGGYDPGAIYDDRQEKDITLQISRKIKQYLEEAGVEVYMTRSEDRFVALAERVEVSNTIEPDAFVSVHANALPTNPRMEGLQTYYFHGKSKALASAVHQQLLDDVKMPDQRIRTAGFWVVKHTKEPSILIETGFMTCPKERRRLVDDNYQTDIAKAIARGLVKYLEHDR